MSQVLEEILVKLSEPLSDETIALSALDQQAQRNYAKLLLVFKLDQSRNIKDIVHHLKQGLGAALSENPEFASTVAPLPGSDRKELELLLGPESGVPFKVVNHTVNATENSPEDKHPWKYGSYSDLAEQHFPLADIPHDVLFLPIPTSEDAPATTISAFPIQLNFVDGGLIMGICWHHTVCDAHGVSNLVNSWVHHTKMSITQGTVGPPKIPPEQTRERWRLDYGSKDATIDQLTDYVVDPVIRSPLSPDSAHLLDRHDDVDSHTISVWHFSTDTLKSLRDSLAQPMSEGEARFTQSEALSALIWKHLSLARQLNQDPSGEGTSLFTTRVDYRTRISPPLHPDFIGNITEPNARVRIPLQEVCAPSTGQSLATLSQAIRSAIENLDESAVRTVIGLVNNLPAVTDLTWKYNAFPGPDLGFTDMSGLDALGQDWGELLGFPICVRSHSRETGIVYVLPQDRDGGIEVQLQCENEAVERLKADDIFTRYATFRC